MAERSQIDHLQPSLLDRLTDDAPGTLQESRDHRVLSLRRLRECVLRDLGWLLNSDNLSSVEALDDYPLVAVSVINYGLPDFAGRTLSAVDMKGVEQAVRQAIWDFEPRILRHTVEVHAILPEGEVTHNALMFEIRGQLWAEPIPLALYVKTELDLETGSVQITDFTT